MLAKAARRRLSAIFVVTLSLWTLPTSAMAADRIKVSLGLTGNDNVTSKAESYLRSELGSLKDVDIVNRDADLIVKVKVLETGGAQKTSVAVAMMVLTPFSNRFITTAAQDQYKEKVGNLTRDLFYSPDLYVHMGNELQQVCKDAIAQLDHAQFEDIRKTRRQIEDAFRPYMPAGKK